jgi:hypothetical protein
MLHLPPLSLSHTLSCIHIYNFSLTHIFSHIPFSSLYFFSQTHLSPLIHLISPFILLSAFLALYHPHTRHTPQYIYSYDVSAMLLGAQKILYIEHAPFFSPNRYFLLSYKAINH